MKGCSIRSRTVAALLLCALLPGCTRFGGAYKVAIDGAPSRSIRRQMEASSDLVEFRATAPGSPGLLRSRAIRDAQRMVEVLRSEGYYEGIVTPRIVTGGRKPVAHFTVKAGPIFRLGELKVDNRGAGDAAQVRVPSSDRIGLEPGASARAQDIVAAQDNLLHEIQAQGFPFPRVVDRLVTVDHATRLVAVTFVLDPGRPARFGPTRIEGLKRLRPEYIRNLVSWDEGAPYDVRKVDALRKRLSKSGLFSLIDVSSREGIRPDGTLPLVLDLRERRRRTFEAGVAYRSDEGAGARTAWENRNLFGGGERLRLRLEEFQKTGYSGEAELRKPEFLRLDQTLVLSGRAAEDSADAYISRNETAQVMLERTLNESLSAAAGGALRYEMVEQFDIQQRFLLGSLPVQANFDSTDDPLDSSRGGKVSARVEPFFDLTSSDLGFVRTFVSLDRYTELAERPRLTLAGRVTGGNISGAARGAVPADLRFYSGGGGSLRGYAYQTVGPLEGDEPLGGLSLFECSGEMRVKTAGHLGYVLFLDGGSAFENSLGDPSGDRLRWGTGGGIRYFTPLGPIRFDVGVPLNRRTGTDRPYQFYISLGQAF